MTLKEFAIESGVTVFECEPGWGGKYGYTESQFPQSRVNGFRSQKACYEDWFKCKFGEQTAKALMKLLKK